MLLGLGTWGEALLFSKHLFIFKRIKHKPKNYTNELKIARINSDTNTHLNELETKGAQPQKRGWNYWFVTFPSSSILLPLPFPFSFLSSTHLYLKGTYQLLCGWLVVMRLPKCDSLIYSTALQIASHRSSNLCQLISAKLLWFLLFWERNELLCQQPLSCQCYSPAKQRAWKWEFS